MATEATHIHWDGTPLSVVNVLGQNLELTAEVSNAIIVRTDPIGTVRIRANGSVLTGLATPTNGWEAIPGTSPVLEANATGFDAVGYIQIRESAQRFVSTSGGTMTGDLIISNAYLRQTRTVAAAASIPAPALVYNFTTVPLTTDPNIFQVSINGAPADLTAWLNEVGHYRAEQRTNFLFDHLITLIASFAVGTGRLIRFERRDAANARVITGGINQDGLLETSLYSFITAGFVIDPGATGKYTILAAANVATIGGRREFDDLVRLQGRISVTAAGFVAGDVIMQVPARFIPAQNRWLNTTTSGGISVPCEILAVSGNVVCRRTQAGAANIAYDDIVYKTSNT